MPMFIDFNPEVGKESICGTIGKKLNIHNEKSLYEQSLLDLSRA